MWANELAVQIVAKYECNLFLPMLLTIYKALTSNVVTIEPTNLL